ncbi:sulfite exporter TauE/SafE family protein, partial [Chlamydiales bacterium]|nr:sulfite exporter TauE/SafE family protein [Chlamydiales bacterium]
ITRSVNATRYRLYFLMEYFEFSSILFLSSLFAGLLGALSGLGGGIIIVPLLMLGFNIDTQYAVGASLISVIATSSGASVAFLKEGFTNIRLGIFLATATSIGAIIGAYANTHLPDHIIQIIFGCLLIYSVVTTYSRKKVISTKEIVLDPLTKKLHLDSHYPTANGPVYYQPQRALYGWCMMLIAGIFSGLLGIGSGIFKGIGLEQGMSVPYKVSSTTSNYIMGMTAAASAGAFLHLGYISPPIVMPLIPGILIGSNIGAKLMMKVKPKKLKHLFMFLVLIIAVQMISEGFNLKF